MSADTDDLLAQLEADVAAQKGDDGESSDEPGRPEGGEEEPQEGASGGGLIDQYQAGVLSDRYLEMVLADWKNTGLLLMQAPLLAAMAVAVWGNVERATPTLYFVMVLSMFWVGCMNACREIVKERALFLRERMFNLDVGAYLFSKIRVLSLVAVMQVGLYTVICAKWIDTRVPIGWLGLTLLATAICGTCLGLLISSGVKRSDYAVAWVPLVIIPQIIFSEFTIDADQFQGISEWAFRLMPARWPFEALMEFGQTSPHYFTAVGYVLPALIYSALFLMVAYPILRVQRY